MLSRFILYKSYRIRQCSVCYRKVLNCKCMVILLLCLGPLWLVKSTRVGVTSIAKTIAEQEEMEHKLRASFDILFSSYIKDSAFYKSYFMYACDQMCAHSYENGLVSAFLFAVLSGRKFIITPKNGHLFYDGIYDLEYGNWQINKSILLNKSVEPVFKPGVNKGRVLSDFHLTRSGLELLDFEKHFTSDIMVLSGDHELIQDLRHNPLTSRKLHWLYQTHAADFIRLVHNGLFRVKDKLQDRIKTSLMETIGDNKLACFVGYKKNMKMDSLVKLMSSNYDDTYKLYVTDYDKTSQENDFKDDMKSEIVHLNIDNILESEIQYGNGGTRDRLLKNNVQVHILKFCDVLISAGSSVGLLAAHLRRSPTNLYCYRDGSIFPCTRELIGGSFWNKHRVPEPVDISYLCSKKDMNCIFGDK